MHDFVLKIFGDAFVHYGLGAVKENSLRWFDTLVLRKQDEGEMPARKNGKRYALLPLTGKIRMLGRRQKRRELGVHRQ